MKLRNNFTRVLSKSLQFPEPFDHLITHTNPAVFQRSIVQCSEAPGHVPASVWPMFFFIEIVRSQLFSFLIACEAGGFVWLRKLAKLARARVAKPRGDWSARSRALRRFATH